jgi:hypothetical protein
MERRVRRCQDGLHFGPSVTGSSRSSPATCDRPRESHKLFLGTAACDCTCEFWGNAGIPQDMREAPNRLIFPRLSHRINVLTPILSPCVAWRCLRVERAMGIEPTAQAWEAWVLPLYDARAKLIITRSQRRANCEPPGRALQLSRGGDSPVASISTSRSSRQTSARKNTMEVEGRRRGASARRIASRSAGRRT